MASTMSRHWQRRRWRERSPGREADLTIAPHLTAYNPRPVVPHSLPARLHTRHGKNLVASRTKKAETCMHLCQLTPMSVPAACVVTSHRLSMNFGSLRWVAHGLPVTKAGRTKRISGAPGRPRGWTTDFRCRVLRNPVRLQGKGHIRAQGRWPQSAMSR